MKMLVIAAAAACLLSPVAASAKDAPIVVSPKPLQEWVADTSNQLDRVLNRIDMSRADSGVSYVQFTADRGGKPANIRTVMRGSTNLDRAARIAVQRLHLLPLAGIREDQVYEAAIILADNQAELDGLRNRVAANAAERNARLAARGLPNTVISLAAATGF